MQLNLNACKAMNAMEDRARESQFATETSVTRAGGSSGAANTCSTSTSTTRASPASEPRVATNATNGSGNASHRGRGRHRLKQERSAARADRSAYVCASLAALAVPLPEPQPERQPVPEPVSSQASDHCDSAFDNKAFSSDGDSGEEILALRHSVGSQVSVNRNQRVLALRSDHSSHSTTNSRITDPLIHNESNISDNCFKSDNKEKNCFMKTNNESDSSLKEQICSSNDTNRDVSRSRSTRSTRSSVVKHIGVFYSDLCDVIKAMRSGTQSNSNNSSNNSNNISSNPTTTSLNTTSQPQEASSATRTSLSAPVVLQNEHLIGSTHHPQQHPTHSPYPVQPQSAITCLHSSPHQSQTMSGAAPVRSPPQTPMRVDSHVTNLPDILNSHLPPPPYSTLPPALQLPPLSSLPPLVERGRNTPIRAPPPPPPPPPLPAAGRPPLPSRRILHAPTAVLAHCSRPNYLRPTCAVSETETSASKTCLSCNGLSIRWFILLIAFIGLLCAIIGTILGALRSTGREHLTLALLMIGELSMRSFI